MDNGIGKEKTDWQKIVMAIYEDGPEVIDKNQHVSRRTMARVYSYLIERAYPYPSDLDEAMERNGYSTRRRFYRVQKDFAGRHIVVLPVDFLKKEKGDRVRVEFANVEGEKRINVT